MRPPPIYRNALAAALLALGPGASAAETDFWRAAEDHGPDPAHEKYEQLFDASYPARGFDPFLRLHPFEEVRAFNEAFDRRAAGVVSRVTEAGATVAVEIEWPGSADQALDVKVERRTILLKAASPARASPYRFVAAAREVVVPVPASAKPESARVERSGDAVRVTFSRRS